MNIVTSKRDLLSALTRANGVAESRGTMPALSMALLEAGDGLRISATGLYLSTSTSIEAEVDKRGSFAVPAKDLLDRVKMMPDGPIELTADQALVVKAKGAARRFTLRGMPGDDYPPMAKPDAEAPIVTLDAGVVLALISRTEHAISDDATRAHLNSLLVEIEGDTMRAVSTDGHRLTKAERTIEGSASTTWLVPKKAVGELRRLLDGVEGPIQASQSGAHLFVTAGETTFGVKLVDAAFPPYAQVIPQGHPHTIRVARTVLADAVRAVSVAASDRAGGIKFAIEAGMIRVSSESPDKGDGTDEVDCEYAGPRIVIGFNAKYVVDALTAAQTDEVELSLGGELEPMVVQPVGEDGLLCVVMPMRV